MRFLGCFVAERPGKGYSAPPDLLLGEKGEGFLPPPPPALSWAPQDRMSSEMEFTIKLSTLFAHIIPTVIL